MAESIHLTALIFHYQTGEGRLDPESILVCVQGSRAHLEVTVPAVRGEGLTTRSGQSASHVVRHEPPGPSQLAPQDVPLVREVAPNTVEIGAKQLQDLLDRGERVVAGMWAGGWLSTLGRKPQPVESPIADGVMEANGFRLTNPKWAGVIGLEAGDVILTVDGRAVNSLGDLSEAYQRLHRPGQRPRFEVTLERDGVPLTHTCLIR